MLFDTGRKHTNIFFNDRLHKVFLKRQKVHNENKYRMYILLIKITPQGRDRRPRLSARTSLLLNEISLLCGQTRASVPTLWKLKTPILTSFVRHIPSKEGLGEALSHRRSFTPLSFRRGVGGQALFPPCRVIHIHFYLFQRIRNG